MKPSWDDTVEVAQNDAPHFDDTSPVDAAPQESWKDYLVRGALKAANTVDSYTGAPVRAAIGSLQDGNLDFGKAASAYGKQFGADPSTAPTGKQIAETAGVTSKSLSDAFPSAYNDTGEGWKLQKGGWADISASGAAGLGIDVAADPTNFIPVGKIAKYGGQALEKIAPRAVNIAARGAEALTGVPAREVETYMRNVPGINRAAKRYGGDVAQMADEVRKGFASDISGARQARNAVISAEKAAAPQAPIEIAKVVEAMEAAKAKLNPKFKANDIAEIDEMIAQVKSAADPNLTMDLANTYDLKQHLQDLASGSYKKDGQIFIPGTDAARAAKSGASEARGLTHANSPGIASADKDLSLLHSIEKRMNKNLISEGKPDAALLAAGSGNQRNRNMLQSLGRLTGTDMVGKVDELAAVRRFGKPEWLPVDTTGKSFTRMAAGRALLGAGIAGAAGENPLYGLALASPAALKMGINAGHYGVGALSAAGKAMSSPLAKPLYMGAMGAARSAQNKEKKPPATFAEAVDFFKQSQTSPAFGGQNR